MRFLLMCIHTSDGVKEVEPRKDFIERNAKYVQNL